LLWRNFLALSIDDFSTIAKAILDCVQLQEQEKAFELIQEKLNQLSLIEFESNAEIQTQFIRNIVRLKRARYIIRIQISNYEPIIQSAWLKLINKLDERIEFLKRKKRNHANGDCKFFCVNGLFDILKRSFFYFK